MPARKPSFGKRREILNPSVKDVKLTDYEKIRYNEFIKNMNEPVYCIHCGKPILKTTDNEMTYEAEIRNKTHVECYRQYQMEQAEKHARERMQPKQ